MIWEAKGMIAGCMDRMRQSACGGCERRDPCTALFQRLGFGFAPGRRDERAGEAPPAPKRSPFLAFLDEMAKSIEARAKPQPSAFQREVEARMEPLLASGAVRIEQVAREMGYSRQTLYRRLKAEDVTFEQLLDRLRRRLALRFVREEGLSVKEAAYRLGFSDPAAFSRAFKRWTGKSPSDMRRPKPH
jgi:AraC-like DNA-binding protein